MKRGNVFLVSLLMLMGVIILLLFIGKLGINGYVSYDEKVQGENLALQKGLTGNSIWEEIIKAFGFEGEEEHEKVFLQTSPLSMTTASRTSGVAPLAVFFDAVDPTASGVSDLGAARPFHELQYSWDFGDVNSGNWVTDGKPKNKATGAVAAHVFETPGDYNITLTISDGTQNQSYTQTITVQDPNVVF